MQVLALALEGGAVQVVLAQAGSRFQKVPSTFQPAPRFYVSISTWLSRASFPARLPAFGRRVVEAQ